MNNGQNPLTQYYRTAKHSIKLPSGTKYYTDGEVVFDDSGELSIKPMTGQDELTMKNPDALLNGSAITNVIKSCVEGVNKPELLLSNDVDVLMVATRMATYGETMDVEVKCPKCGHDNEYQINLATLLETIDYLDDNYPVNLDNGLTVFVKPFTYKDTLKALRCQFEQTKIMKSMESDSITEERRLELFSQSFNSISALNGDLVANSIINVVNEADNIDVSDRTMIADFLKNIDKKSFDKIETSSKEVNKIGLKRELSAVCRNEECQHEWEAAIDFNPVNFFTGS